MLVRAEPGHLMLLYLVLEEDIMCCSIKTALDSLCEEAEKPFQTLPKASGLGGAKLHTLPGQDFMIRTHVDLPLLLSSLDVNL